VITLITGMPGDGKTLYTIALVKALAEKEKRPVFYSGIRALSLPWIQFGEPSPDPENPHFTVPDKWHELPAGAIIVIDEAQRAFRPRSNGSAVPEHVAKLETHRHKGHDLFLITQQPLLVDSNVRRLVGRHFHCKRKFGMQNSTVHEWSQVNSSPDQVRKDSIRHEFAFPKDLYAVYKSAEVHTHRVRIPMRFWMLILLPFLAAGLLYFAVSKLIGRAVDPLPESVKERAGVISGPVHGPAPTVARSGGAVTPAEYIESFKPRIPELAHTAPRYDAAFDVVNVPYPAACLSMGKRCKCYTDQATVLNLSPYLCREIVAKGYFVEFAVHRPEPRRRASVDVETKPALPLVEKPDSFTIPGYRHVEPVAVDLVVPVGAGVDRTRPDVQMVGPFDGK
jgi:hypothetical protein